MSVGVRRALGTASLLALVLGAVACSDQPKGTGEGLKSNSAGQVAAPVAAPKVSAYAAARFLEQASWGPTPNSVAEVQALGFEAWLEKQFALPVTQMTNVPHIVGNYDRASQAENRQAYEWPKQQTEQIILTAPDQLRVRTSWALFNFIPVSSQPLGMLEYFNMLQRNAFGPHRNLLIDVTKDPAMGHFLNNTQNNKFKLNENYARELMQLFTVGLVQLNLDGSIKRDSAGRPLETYTQDDVRATTRALTGWRFDNSVPNLSFPGNFANFGYPQVPNADSHDKDAKQLLGKTIPAGQTVEQDLASVVDVLLGHPNAAPFLARRLIQAMVSSEPSAAYIQRVSQAYLSGGKTLKAAVKAVLLDPEARAADQLGVDESTGGRIKEPLLFSSIFLRGMGCTSKPENFWFGGGQSFYDVPNVFGYISPDYRTPGSQVNAPEHALLDTSMISQRTTMGFYPPMEKYLAAGCDFDELMTRIDEGPSSALNFLAQRFFRGAMPVAVRSELQALLERSTNNTADVRAQRLISYMAAAAEFGVVR